MKIILVDAVNTFVVDGAINTDMQAMLNTFPNKKIIVTNANSDEVEEYGLVNMPYEMFSLNHNPNKTDPIYFEKLLAAYDFQLSDLLYFEHNADAVASAQSLGITAMHYDKDKKDIEAVKVFIENNG